MILTTLQVQHLHQKSYKELSDIYKVLKQHTKKLSKKEDITKEISTIIDLLNNFRSNLSKELKCSVKTYTKSNIEEMDAVDLRQAHASFRQALQCNKTNKSNMIQSLIKLCKQVNFFIHY